MPTGYDFEKLGFNFPRQVAPTTLSTSSKDAVGLKVLAAIKGVVAKYIVPSISAEIKECRHHKYFLGYIYLLTDS